MKKSQPTKRTARSAHKVELKPIQEVAQHAGIKKKFLESYGKFKAKVSLDILKSVKNKKIGKYVLITSITPTHMGEGKTVTAIGLSMALNRLKKKSIASLLQPSLGGMFGIKGPGSGAGLAQVLPREDVNLYLTGDSYAVLAAHNLCAAYLDNVIFRGNSLDIDLDSITWQRAAEFNDRSLRNVNIGQGSKTDGVPRKTGCDLTASSELMAVLALSENMKDLRERVGRIVLGYNKKGKPITCEDIKAAGAMTSLLKNALKPNILQTTEHTPCLVHTGSMGDLSLGTSSVIADKIALGLSDYVIAETGFGADMGAERLFDIKCRTSGIRPDVAVIVCSIRGLKMHSGDYDVIPGKPFPREITRENVSAVERGLSNLEKQVENLKTFDIPFIVCLNRFNEDTEKEIAVIKSRAEKLGANGMAISTVYANGSEGGVELARCVIEACKIKHSFRYLYPLDLPIKDKVKRVAKSIYGAKEVVFSDEANTKVTQLKKLKLNNLPVCIAKTPLSFSHSAKRKGRPHGFKLPVEDLEVASGAGYILILCGHMKTMPGLPKIPRGVKVDVDEEGRITGLF